MGNNEWLERNLRRGFGVDFGTRRQIQKEIVGKAPRALLAIGIIRS